MDGERFVTESTTDNLSPVLLVDPPPRSRMLVA
jgi:hypothetical protein